MALTRPTQYSILCTGVKVGKGRLVWIHKEKTREEIQVILVNKVMDPKRLIGKMDQKTRNVLGTTGKRN
jgi:hypothetical protein